MGGLRGFGREMWRQIALRPGRRPSRGSSPWTCSALTADELGAMVTEAALVVPSFGYRSEMLPVFDANGARLTLNAELGGVAVGEAEPPAAQRRHELAQPVRHRIGHRLQAAASMGGEPNFNGQANSLWLYHNDIGAIIYRAIHEQARASATAAAVAA
jgi:hypothetical protein